MTPTQLETVRAARLQLIDLGDEATATLLDWAVTAEAVEPVKSRKSYRFHMNLDATPLGAKLFDTLETKPPGCGVIAQVYPDGFVATILTAPESRAVSELLGGNHEDRKTYLGES